MKKAQVLWLIFGAVALLFLIGAATVQPGRPISQYPRVTVLQGTDIFPIARTNVTPATNMGVTGFVISNYVVSIATGAVEIVAGTNVIITSTTNGTGGQTHTISVTNTFGAAVSPPLSSVQYNSNSVQSGSSLFVFTNSMVGIGTNAPAYPLHLFVGDPSLTALEISYTNGAGNTVAFQVRSDTGATNFQVEVGGLVRSATIHNSGSITGAAATVTALAVTGGTLGAGKVLTDVSGTGAATWQTGASLTDVSNIVNNGPFILRLDGLGTNTTFWPSLTSSVPVTVNALPKQQVDIFRILSNGTATVYSKFNSNGFLTVSGPTLADPSTHNMVNVTPSVGFGTVFNAINVDVTDTTTTTNNALLNLKQSGGLRFRVDAFGGIQWSSPQKWTLTEGSSSSASSPTFNFLNIPGGTGFGVPGGWSGMHFCTAGVDIFRTHSAGLNFGQSTLGFGSTVATTENYMRYRAASTVALTNGTWEVYSGATNRVPLIVSAASGVGISTNLFEAKDASGNIAVSINTNGVTTAGLNVTGGTLGAGKVLTDVSGTGAATWETGATLSGVTNIVTNYVNSVIGSFVNLSVQAAKLPSTNYPAIDAGWQNWELIYYPTNSEGFTNSLGATWQFVVPLNYFTNNMKVYGQNILLTTNGPTSTNIYWRASFLRATSGDSTDVHVGSFGSSVTVTQTWAASATGTNKIQSFLIDMGTSSLLQANDFSILKLERVNDVADTNQFKGSTSLIGLQLRY